MKAQHEQCTSEGRGIPIDQSDLDHALELHGNAQKEFPFFLPGTKQSDMDEAIFVLNQPVVTPKDLAWFWSRGDDDKNHGDYNKNDDNEETASVDFSGMASYDDTALLRDNVLLNLTPETQRLHHSLEKSQKDNNYPLDEQDKVDAFKSIKDCLDFVANDRHCTKGDMRKFVATVQAGFHEYVKERQEKRVANNKVGGVEYFGGSPVKGRVPLAKRYKGVGG